MSSNNNNYKFVGYEPKRIFDISQNLEGNRILFYVRDENNDIKKISFEADYLVKSGAINIEALTKLIDKALENGDDNR